MRAKVADFGLVRNAPEWKYSVETRLAGTFGYLAPEYAASGRVTTKVDIYAFGVVLMEILRKVLDENMPNEKSQLVTWFRRVLIRSPSTRISNQTKKLMKAYARLPSWLATALLVNHSKGPIWGMQ